MEALDFAVEVAKGAGQILLEHRGGDLTRTIKRHEQDYATEADYASEKFILGRIREVFPDDAIVAEESGAQGRAEAEYTWIVDPLDGTRNFATGSDYFGVFMARCHGSVVELAVAYSPVDDLLATATHGGGTWLNGQKVDLRQAKNLETKPFAANLDLHAALRPLRESKTKLSAISTTLDALQGEHGAYVTNAGCVWDFVVPALLLAEAGWKVTTFAGKPYTWDGKTDHRWPAIIAAEPALHAQILQLVKDWQA